MAKGKIVYTLLKLCSIILYTLLFQKHKNPKIFPTFALTPL